MLKLKIIAYKTVYCDLWNFDNDDPQLITNVANNFCDTHN